MRSLNIPVIFKREAEDFRKARQEAITIHGTADIRAAGNEIEIHIREFFKRMLPKTLYVTHGHLIDSNGLVSPQLDIIIADVSNLPSLMTTKDGTEYIPIDSVYACGEIKSTYYKSSKYIESFTEVLSKIKNKMFHEKIPNTAYYGLVDEALLEHIYLAKENRTLNNIYTFMLFVDSGDFSFQDVKPHFKSSALDILPPLTVLLNKGVIFYGSMKDNGMNHSRYPEEESRQEGYTWHFSPFVPKDEDASIDGNCLGFLYYSILQHINNSHLAPSKLDRHMASMQIMKKSTLESIEDR